MTTAQNARSRSREITPGPLGLWLERALVGTLFLLVIAAPNSIAATQAAWFLGLVFWVLRFAVWPRPKLDRTPLDYPMFGFFLLSGLSSFLSYSPIISIGKLRAACLFTIVYLFAENVRSRRVLRALAIVLIAACMINVFYTFAEYAMGRGAKVYGVTANSPLNSAKLVSRERIQPIPILSGDTLEEIDGQPVRDVEDLIKAFQTSRKDPARIRVYRVEWVAVLEVPRGHLLPGASPEERLGIQRWTHGRDWRATGFYNHWTTYAESLQLIASLVVGLLVALPRKWSRNGLLLSIAIAGMGIALLLSVTRASWL